MEIGGERFKRKLVIDRCIYCGKTEVPLTKEHIVPYCLGGQWVLHKASCSEHAEVTRRFEGHVSSEHALVFRTIKNLPTRRKSRRPSTLPLEVQRGGKKDTIDCPLELYPLYLALEVFAPPAIIDGRKYIKGIDVTGIAYLTPQLEKLQRLRDELRLKA